jgi:hypothetical protein
MSDQDEQEIEYIEAESGSKMEKRVFKHSQRMDKHTRFMDLANLDLQKREADLKEREQGHREDRLKAQLAVKANQGQQNSIALELALFNQRRDAAQYLLEIIKYMNKVKDGFELTESTTTNSRSTSQKGRELNGLEEDLYNNALKTLTRVITFESVNILSANLNSATKGAK